MAYGRHLGHSLVAQGAPHSDDGHRLTPRSKVLGEGRGKCQCGALSPPTGSVSARRRWHREHVHAMEEDHLHELRRRAVAADEEDR